MVKNIGVIDPSSRSIWVSCRPRVGRLILVHIKGFRRGFRIYQMGGSISTALGSSGNPSRFSTTVLDGLAWLKVDTNSCADLHHLYVQGYWLVCSQLGISLGWVGLGWVVVVAVDVAVDVVVAHVVVVAFTISDVV